MSKELSSIIAYVVSSCGSGKYDVDVKKAIEICVGANKLSSAYTLILYLLNGGGIPKYHPIPLPYVLNIEDICVINPEGLAGVGLELLALPTPERREHVIEVKTEDESKKRYRALIAEVWGVLISYRSEAGLHHKAIVFTLSRVGTEVTYTAVEPPPQITEKLVKVCRGEEVHPPWFTEEGRKILTESKYAEVIELTKDEEGKVRKRKP